MRVCLHQAHGFVSAAIRWQSRSLYSHVSLEFSDLTVIESREFIGVHKLPKLAPRPGEIIDLYTLKHGEHQERAIRVFMESQLGKGYDYLSVLRFVTRQNIEHWRKTCWFCSELVFYSLRLAELDLLKNIHAWEVAPGHVAISPILHFDKRIRG